MTRETAHRHLGTAASAVYPAAPQVPISGDAASGKLNGYLADLNEQAESMFLELVNQMAVRDGVTEQRKAQDQMP